MADMIPINRTFAPLQAITDELSRCGMRHAVTSPGSRNAPIALVLARHPEIAALSVLDERSAGFVALGMAKETGLPVAITCTSGTAVANLLPAVVEAHHARVPLILLTADRPPELRDVGAGQAIDQIGIFGSAVKSFVEVGLHTGDRASAVHHRALACRAYATAIEGRPGPVHLNLALREPLDPTPEELDAGTWAGRAGDRPWADVRSHPPEPDANEVQRLAERIAATPRGALVCGETGDTDLGPSAARFAAAAGWPLLADPLSGVRCGAHDLSHVIARYDVPLRAEAAMRADLVLRVGDTPTSKPLRAWMAQADQAVIDPHGAWHEPTRAAELFLRAAPAAALDALAAALEVRDPAHDDAWLDGWRAADSLVAAALAQAPQPSEPRAYTAVADSLRSGTLVWVASSMPVRDVESFWPPGPRDVRFLSNRGANGIDGTISSAAGAAVSRDGPVVVLTGELALAHDAGGLMAARRLGAGLTIVCVDNAGGGIFDFLAVGKSGGSDYERHIATSGETDVVALAALGGLAYREASTDDEIRAAVTEGPGLVHVRTDRAVNVAVHRQIIERVQSALAARV